MPRTEANVAPGKNLLTYPFSGEMVEGAPEYAVNGNVFQEVSVGGFPQFLFRPHGGMAEAIPYSEYRGGEAGGIQQLLVDYGSLPVVSNSLLVSIPRGMHFHANLIDQSSGISMATFGDKYEAVLLRVLDRPKLDAPGTKRDGRKLAIRHFCTEYDQGGLGRADLNCHRLMLALSLETPTNRGDGNVGEHYICASIPLREHLFSSGFYETDRDQQAEVYQYFSPYFKRGESGVCGGQRKTFGDRVRLIGSYLPNQTVVWYPIFEEDRHQIHGDLKKTGRQKSFTSDKVFYCDRLDMFFTRPEDSVNLLMPTTT